MVATSGTSFGKPPAAATVGNAVPRVESSSADASRWRRNVAWITIATGLAGAVNYVYAVFLARLLSAHDYAAFGAGRTLLLTAGTLADASLPWLLTHQLAAHRPDDAESRTHVLSFATLAGIVEGSVGSIVVFSLATRLASTATAVLLGVATFLLFGASTAIGYAQGMARFAAVSKIRVAEVVLKVGVGLTLVGLGFGVLGALSGYLAADLFVFGWGLTVSRRSLTLSAGALRDHQLWSMALRLGSLQLLVAGLAGADTLVVDLLPGSAVPRAAYQLAAIAGRGPLFLAGALATVAFQALSHGGRDERTVVRLALSAYAAVAVPASVVVASAPRVLLSTLSPKLVGHVEPMLPPAAVAGLAIGALALCAALLQGTRAFSRCVTVLAVGLTCESAAAVVGLRGGGAVGLAWAVAAATVCVAVAMLLCVRAQFAVPLGRLLGRILAAGAALAGISFATRSSGAWYAVAAATSIFCVFALRRATRDV